MLNLDDYINNHVEVTIFGKNIKIKEPTINMIMDIDKIEKNLTVENLREKRLEVGLLMINYNVDGEKFTREQLMQLPFEALNVLIDEVAKMRYKADSDPN